MPDGFEIRVCQNPNCGLRYPLVLNHPFGLRCPRCLGPTFAVLAKKLSSEGLAEVHTPPASMEALLDNVRSAWNVGAIFRTADGLGVQNLYLCGFTPTPEDSSVRKTALGAESSVPWQYASNAFNLASKLIGEGVRLWALEQDERAIPVSSEWRSNGQRIVLIVGNEITGVDPGLLNLCERILYIPMYGAKRSLNVEVAFGVAISGLQSSHRI